MGGRCCGGRWLPLAVATIFRAVGSSQWNTAIADPPFFTQGIYRTYLTHDDHVLTIPAWGPNERWVADAGFPFALSAGYLGNPLPSSYTRYRIWNTLLTGRLYARLRGTAEAVRRRQARDRGGRAGRAAGTVADAVLDARGAAGQHRRRARVPPGATAIDCGDASGPALAVGDRPGLQRGAADRDDRARAARGADRAWWRLGDRGRRQRQRGRDPGAPGAAARGAANPRAAQRDQPRQGLLRPPRDARCDRRSAVAVRRRLQAVAAVAARPRGARRLVRHHRRRPQRARARRSPASSRSTAEPRASASSSSAGG